MVVKEYIATYMRVGKDLYVVKYTVVKYIISRICLLLTAEPCLEQLESLEAKCPPA